MASWREAFGTCGGVSSQSLRTGGCLMLHPSVPVSEGPSHEFCCTTITCLLYKENMEVCGGITTDVCKMISFARWAFGKLHYERFVHKQLSEKNQSYIPGPPGCHI